MKKSILLALSGVLSLTLLHNANAVTVVNDTGERIYIQTFHRLIPLMPNQATNCCFGTCNGFTRFNVKIDNPSGRGLTTVCTISPVNNWDTVRITQILNHTFNGGCYSYYRFVQ